MCFPIGPIREVRHVSTQEVSTIFPPYRCPPLEVGGEVRGAGPTGSSYDADGLNLASFRESSELEFGADDAFILAPDAKDAGRVTLKHLTSRHGETRDIVLDFDKRCQRFSEVEDPSLWKPEAEPAGGKEPAGKLQKALQTLWDRKPAAGDDGYGGES